MSDDDSTTIFDVVVNDEEQYSVWPVGIDLPSGWRATGHQGDRAGCLAHIESVWTDMRPLSLRRWMASQDGVPTRSPEPDPSEDLEPLSVRLAGSDHPVEVELGMDGDLGRLRRAVARGQVLIRFPATRGGTELVFRLDDGASDLVAVGPGDGMVRLVGDAVLDDEPVRCVAELRLPSLVGTGRLMAGTG